MLAVNLAPEAGCHDCMNYFCDLLLEVLRFPLKSAISLIFLHV